MVITYYGEAFVRLQFGDMVIATNPVSRDFDAKASKFGADIALIAQNHPSMNGRDSVSFGAKEAFVIDSPGEYELSGVFVKGLPSVGPHGRINTVYSVVLEGMSVVHLGGLALDKLTPDALEEISSPDILIVPIGGQDSLDPKSAAKFAASLGPKIIIPVLCGDKKDDHLPIFLKDIGADKVSPLDKLSLKKKDLEGKEGEVIVLSPVN